MKSTPTSGRLDPNLASVGGTWLFIALVALALSVPAWAGRTYTSIKTGNWHDSSVWTPAGIPGSGDQALLGNGLVVTCEAGQTCVVGTSPAVSQGGSYAIDCQFTNGTGLLQVYGILQFQGPVRQCNANWLVGQVGVGGGQLLHDNSGSQTALPPASITSGSHAATGIATLNGTFTLPVAQQSVCITGTSTALDGLCGGIISNSRTQILAQFPYYTAIGSLGGSGAATFWPHYEWQICGVAGSCGSALLTANGTAANHAIITNANTSYPAGNFGGFTPGGTGRTNEAIASPNRGMAGTAPIAGGGNVEFHYVDADHLGLPGLQGGSQWLTVSLNLSTSKLILDHVICRPCTAITENTSTAHASSTMKITDSSLGAELIDGIALMLYGSPAFTSTPVNWFMNDTGIFGTWFWAYVLFPQSHVAFFSMPVVGNGPGAPRPGIPSYAGAGIAYATPPVVRDYLIVNNTLGGQGGVGTAAMIATYSRGVYTNLTSSVGSDCIGFTVGYPSALPYNWSMDGIVLETWAPTDNGCGKVRGTFMLTNWTDSTAGNVVLNLSNVLGIPKAVTNAGQPPYQWGWIRRGNTSGRTTNMQLSFHNSVWPGDSYSSPATYGLATIGASAQLGTGGGFLVYNNICFGVGSGKSCRFTVWDGNSGEQPFNGTYTANNNVIFNSTTSGSTIYYDGTSLTANSFSNGKPTFVQTNPGTGDLAANPNFLDSTRNQLTWAQQVNGVTYTGYSPCTGSSCGYGVGNAIGPQVQWQVYGCTVAAAQRSAQGLQPLCYDFDGNNRTWDSHWDWSNNTGGDPTPACYPNCYYDWVTTGFTATNIALKGTGFGGGDVGLMGATPKRHPPAQWRR